MSNMEEMRKDYLSDADMINELKTNPETVIDFDRTWNGRYEFLKCGACNGPMLGHRVEKCRNRESYDENIVRKFETNMRSTPKVREILVGYIKQQKRAEMEYKQDREIDLARRMPAKASLVIGRTEIPKWIGQDFEIWRKELENWESNDQSTDETKYCNVIESLKKNEKIKDFVINVLTVKTDNERKVASIIKVMSDKFERTMSEKYQNIMNEIVDFKTDGNIEETTDKFGKMVIEANKIDLAANLNFAMTLQFINRLEKAGKLSSDEKMRLKDEIETKEGKPKYSDSADRIQKEIKRMKVENNRENIWETKMTDTHFVRESRYGNWKNRMENSGYRRSGSRNGYWRKENRDNGYVKDRNGSRFRSQSNRAGSNRYRSRSNGSEYKERSGSQVKHKSELAKDVEEIKKDMKELKLMIDEIKKTKANSVNHFVAEEFEIDVRYVEETKGINMIVDSGAPVSIATNKWMNGYLRAMKVNKEEIIEKECKRKFRMGENIYLSKQEITLPVRMKTEKEYIRKMITVSIINREDDLFLCGLKTLIEWKAAVFYGKNEMMFDDTKKRVVMNISKGGHQLVKLETLGEVSNEETVLYIEKNGAGHNKKDIEKFHRVLNHKGIKNMEFAYRNAGKLDSQTRKFIRETVENCEICQQNMRSRSKPSIAIPRATDFNAIVTLDLKEVGKKYILWMVDAFTRLITGAVLKDKKAETVLDKIENEWCLRYGYPSVGFYADNGGEFRNYKLEEFVSKMGIKIEFSPAYSPWSNGLNERNHYSADKTVKKIMDEKKNISLEEAVRRASWTHNTNINVSGYTPLTLMTGKSIVHPGITTGNRATESIYEDEAVRKTMETHFEVTKEFREIEFGAKIDKVIETRMKGFEDMIVKKNDKVFYQTNNEKAWLGPAKVIDVDKNWVFIAGNGELKKVPKCNVKLNIKSNSEEDNGNQTEKEEDNDSQTEKEMETKEEDKVENKNKVQFENSGVVTRSMKKLKEGVNEDSVATYWMTVENRENFEDIAVYVVEIPTKEQNTQEVKDAKHREIENLMKFNVFEEVEDCGQPRIGSRWVVTQKEKKDGQKTDIKGRIVAKGFQEEDKPQSDSPTLLRESLKMYFAVAANEKFNIRSLDIRAAFLQAKGLNREIYMEPPKDIKNEGKIWKLQKPLYGLNDASRKFWLKMKEVLTENKMKVLEGDEAFFYRHDEKGDLEGMLSSHVDDLILAGTENFLDEITEKIASKLEISKLADNEFRFTGMDIKKEGDVIVVSMEDYAESLTKIEIRKGNPDDPLTETEMKMFRKYVGKLSWLANNTRPDLAINVLNSARKQKNARLKDLREINRIVEKIKEKENKIVFGRIARKEDIRVLGVSDASYHQENPTISGTMIMIGSKKNKKAAPIFWKSGVVNRVCTSPKASETRGVMLAVDDAKNIADQLKILLNTEIKVKIFTDSRPLLETLGSTSQIAEKGLRQSIAYLKEHLMLESVESYAWIEGKDIVADILTKTGSKRKELDEIMSTNYFRQALDEKNCVKITDGEITIEGLATKSGQNMMY